MLPLRSDELPTKDLQDRIGIMRQLEVLLVSHMSFNWTIQQKSWLYAYVIEFQSYIMYISKKHMK